MNQIPANPEIPQNLHLSREKKLRYIQMRRHGASFEQILQDRTDQQMNRLREKTHDLGEVLLARQQQAQTIIHELSNELESIEIFNGSEFQKTSLKLTVDKLKTIQCNLKEKMEITQAELHHKCHQKADLVQSLNNFSQTLNFSQNVNFKNQHILFEGGGILSQYISKKVQKDSI